MQVFGLSSLPILNQLVIVLIRVLVLMVVVVLVVVVLGTVVVEVWIFVECPTLVITRNASVWLFAFVYYISVGDGIVCWCRCWSCF